jgi:hypothetical protein
MIVRMFLLYLSSKISFCCCTQGSNHFSDTAKLRAGTKKSNRRVQSSPRGMLNSLLWRNAARLYKRAWALCCVYERGLAVPMTLPAAATRFYPRLFLLRSSYLSQPVIRHTCASSVYIYASCPRFLIFSHPLIASSWEKPVLKILMV